jgi:hypothetical protein
MSGKNQWFNGPGNLLDNVQVDSFSSPKDKPASPGLVPNTSEEVQNPTKKNKFLIDDKGDLHLRKTHMIAPDGTEEDKILFTIDGIGYMEKPDELQSPKTPRTPSPVRERDPVRPFSRDKDYVPQTPPLWPAMPAPEPEPEPANVPRRRRKRGEREVLEAPIEENDDQVAEGLSKEQVSSLIDVIDEWMTRFKSVFREIMQATDNYNQSQNGKSVTVTICPNGKDTWTSDDQNPIDFDLQYMNAFRFPNDIQGLELPQKQWQGKNLSVREILRLKRTYLKNMTILFRKSLSYSAKVYALVPMLLKTCMLFWTEKQVDWYQFVESSVCPTEYFRYYGTWYHALQTLGIDRARIYPVLQRMIGSITFPNDDDNGCIRVSLPVPVSKDVLSLVRPLCVTAFRVKSKFPSISMDHLKKIVYLLVLGQYDGKEIDVTTLDFWYPQQTPLTPERLMRLPGYHIYRFFEHGRRLDFIRPDRQQRFMHPVRVFLDQYMSYRNKGDEAYFGTYFEYNSILSSTLIPGTNLYNKQKNQVMKDIVLPKRVALQTDPKGPQVKRDPMNKRAIMTHAQIYQKRDVDNRLRFSSGKYVLSHGLYGDQMCYTRDGLETMKPILEKMGRPLCETPFCVLKRGHSQGEVADPLYCQDDLVISEDRNRRSCYGIDPSHRVMTENQGPANTLMIMTLKYIFGLCDARFCCRTADRAGLCKIHLRSLEGTVQTRNYTRKNVVAAYNQILNPIQYANPNLATQPVTFENLFNMQNVRINNMLSGNPTLVLVVHPLNRPNTRKTWVGYMYSEQPNWFVSLMGYFSDIQGSGWRQQPRDVAMSLAFGPGPSSNSRVYLADVEPHKGTSRIRNTPTNQTFIGTIPYTLYNDTLKKSYLREIYPRWISVFSDNDNAFEGYLVNNDVQTTVRVTVQQGYAQYTCNLQVEENGERRYVFESANGPTLYVKAQPEFKKVLLNDLSPDEVSSAYRAYSRYTNELLCALTSDIAESMLFNETNLFNIPVQEEDVDLDVRVAIHEQPVAYPQSSTKSSKPKEEDVEYMGDTEIPANIQSGSRSNSSNRRQPLLNVDERRVEPVSPAKMGHPDSYHLHKYLTHLSNNRELVPFEGLEIMSVRVIEHEYNQISPDELEVQTVARWRRYLVARPPQNGEAYPLVYCGVDRVDVLNFIRDYVISDGPVEADRQLVASDYLDWLRGGAGIAIVLLMRKDMNETLAEQHVNNLMSDDSRPIQSDEQIFEHTDISVRSSGLVPGSFAAACLTPRVCYAVAFSSTRELLFTQNLCESMALLMPKLFKLKRAPRFKQLFLHNLGGDGNVAATEAELNILRDAPKENWPGKNENEFIRSKWMRGDDKDALKPNKTWYTHTVLLGGLERTSGELIAVAFDLDDPETWSEESIGIAFSCLRWRGRRGENDESRKKYEDWKKWCSTIDKLPNPTHALKVIRDTVPIKTEVVQVESADASTSLIRFPIDNPDELKISLFRKYLNYLSGGNGPFDHSRLKFKFIPVLESNIEPIMRQNGRRQIKETRVTRWRNYLVVQTPGDGECYPSAYIGCTRNHVFQFISYIIKYRTNDDEINERIRLVLTNIMDWLRDNAGPELARQLNPELSNSNSNSIIEGLLAVSDKEISPNEQILKSLNLSIRVRSNFPESGSFGYHCLTNEKVMNKFTSSPNSNFWFDQSTCVSVALLKTLMDDPRKRAPRFKELHLHVVDEKEAITPEERAGIEKLPAGNKTMFARSKWFNGSTDYVKPRDKWYTHTVMLNAPMLDHNGNVVTPSNHIDVAFDLDDPTSWDNESINIALYCITRSPAYANSDYKNGASQEFKQLMDQIEQISYDLPQAQVINRPIISIDRGQPEYIEVKSRDIDSRYRSPNSNQASSPQVPIVRQSPGKSPTPVPSIPAAYSNSSSRQTEPRRSSRLPKPNPVYLSDKPAWNSSAANDYFREITGQSILPVTEPKKLRKPTPSTNIPSQLQLSRSRNTPDQPPPKRLSPIADNDGSTESSRSSSRPSPQSEKDHSSPLPVTKPQPKQKRTKPKSIVPKRTRKPRSKPSLDDNKQKPKSKSKTRPKRKTKSKSNKDTSSRADQSPTRESLSRIQTRTARTQTEPKLGRGQRERRPNSRFNDS